MDYRRVIPRDLFNEANLLKCYGQLWIHLNEHVQGSLAALDYTEGADGDAFDVRQNDMSGGLDIANIALTIDGIRWDLFRPLNSRYPWPLYCTDLNGETEVAVFDEDGNLSAEFLALIKAEHYVPNTSS